MQLTVQRAATSSHFRKLLCRTGTPYNVGEFKRCKRLSRRRSQQYSMSTQGIVRLYDRSQSQYHEYSVRCVIE